MSDRPWMPLYTGDYLRDTRRLSLAEHGAYLLLIMAYWDTGKPLPDDDRVLARIVGTTATEWAMLRPAMYPFFVVEDGVWRHKRIDQELARTTAIRQKRREAAQSSWARRRKSSHLRIID